MAEIITREEIAMWRGHLFGLLPHQTFAMPRATLDIILDAAEASLSHPAALERARAEGAEAMREACAQHFVGKAKRLGRGAAWQKTRIQGGPEVYRRHSDDDPGDDWLPDNGPAIALRGAMANAAAIRALGPVPRPSPEAEAPKESATKWLAVNFRKRAQALRVAAEHGESPAAWHAAAETYETAAGVAERWRPTPGAVEAPTPPALAPEMRERLAKVLQWAGGLGNSIYSPEARALLSALSPQTDGGAK